MSRTLGFLILCMVAALAACGQHVAGGAPMTPYGARATQPRAAGLTHAPCVPLAALHSPVKGTPPISIAFGQLVADSSNTRYAFPGVEYAYHGGKYVYAATSGRATYYASLSGYGQAIVVKSAAGVETLYSGFARPVKQFVKSPRLKVKSGEVIAVAGALPLRFEYAPSGNVLAAGTQSNPCGSGSDGASGTISIMPSEVAVFARFHALSLDGTPLPAGAYPSGSPDVATPSNLAVSNVIVAHAAAPAVYEHSDVFSGFYVVLCGNVVFAAGPLRSAGPFPYPSPTASSSAPLVTPSLPPLVFFRDPGRFGAALAAPLPAPYARGCPAPAPGNFYVFASPAFNEVGQTKYVYYTADTPQPGNTPIDNDTVTFTSSDASVVTTNPASPSPLAVFPTAPPPWPPPSPRADITAAGIGTATIAVYDSSCQCTDAPINVTVNPTPSPAPVPTPIPN
jgi:hypothetical protein